jgi:LytS/YehU family sensor histidine kinase
MVMGLFFDIVMHPPDSFWKKLLNYTWLAVYVTFINYFLFERTLPSISRKNIVSSFFRLVLYLFLYSWGSFIWRGIGIQIHFYTVLTTFNSVSKNVSAQMAYSVGSIIFFGITRHIYNYIQLKQTTQQLRIEKQQAELNYLKSQTNPHFLFNTLNNIYSLARDKSDLAPESILRLSKILRYMLYETSGSFIAIEQELKMITDYIALEKLRYDDSLRINFNYDIEDMKQAMPPLLLMPLVENAFKHGVSETPDRPFIDIHLAVNKRQLTLLVKNSSEIFTGQQTVKENIGLSNLRRQLELLYTDYDLFVQHHESMFIATLKINLASYVSH